VDPRLLEESVEDMLRERQFAGPAVALLMHFPGLKLEFEAVEVMLTLASDGQLSTAQSWAVELGSEAQVPFDICRSIWIILTCIHRETDWISNNERMEWGDLKSNRIVQMNHTVVFL